MFPVRVLLTLPTPHSSRPPAHGAPNQARSTPNLSPPEIPTRGGTSLASRPRQNLPGLPSLTPRTQPAPGSVLSTSSNALVPSVPVPPALPWSKPRHLLLHHHNHLPVSLPASARPCQPIPHPVARDAPDSKEPRTLVLRPLQGCGGPGAGPTPPPPYQPQLLLPSSSLRLVVLSTCLASVISPNTPWCPWSTDLANAVQLKHHLPGEVVSALPPLASPGLLASPSQPHHWASGGAPWGSPWPEEGPRK